MKWVPCSRCAMTELFVRDDFDELTEIELCDDCWAQLDRLTERELFDDITRWGAA